MLVNLFRDLTLFIRLLVIRLTKPKYKVIDVFGFLTLQTQR